LPRLLTDQVVRSVRVPQFETGRTGLFELTTVFAAEARRGWVDDVPRIPSDTDLSEVPPWVIDGY
jgi:hypothetical protein